MCAAGLGAIIDMEYVSLLAWFLGGIYCILLVPLLCSSARSARQSQSRLAKEQKKPAESATLLGRLIDTLLAADKLTPTYVQLVDCWRQALSRLFGNTLFSWRFFCCCYFISVCYVVTLSLWRDGISGDAPNGAPLFILLLYLLCAVFLQPVKRYFMTLLCRPSSTHGQRPQGGTRVATILSGGCAGALLGGVAYTITAVIASWREIPLGGDGINVMGFLLLSYGGAIGLTAALLDQWGASSRKSAKAAIGKQLLQSWESFLLSSLTFVGVLITAVLSLLAASVHWSLLISFPLLVVMVLCLGFGITAPLVRIMGRNLLFFVVPMISLVTLFQLPHVLFYSLNNPWFFMLSFMYAAIALPHAIAIYLALAASRFFLQQTRRVKNVKLLPAPIALDLVAGFFCAILLMWLSMYGTDMQLAWMAVYDYNSDMQREWRMVYNPASWDLPRLAAETGPLVAKAAPWSNDGLFSTLFLLSALFPASVHLGLGCLAVASRMIGGINDTALWTPQQVKLSTAKSLQLTKVTGTFMLIVVTIFCLWYILPFELAQLIYWFLPKSF